MTGKVFSSEHAFPSKILNLFRTFSSWGSSHYRPSAPLLYEVASHVKKLPFRPLFSIVIIIEEWRRAMEGRWLKINRKKTVYLRFIVDGNLDGNSYMLIEIRVK